MNYEDFSEIASLYALNILEAEYCHEVEDEIAKFPQFQEDLAQLEAAVAAIPYTTPLMPISANLKDRLFQRIEEDISGDRDWDRLSVADLIAEAAKVAWQPYSLPGVTIGRWKLDMEKREVSCFIRATSGIQFYNHRHAGNEEIVVLEGDLAIDGEKYNIGDRVFSDPGSVHQPETYSGCLIFVRTSLDDEIIVY
ncbi:MAG TPA: anti-sigma factor [Cyanobacteria bacterium UBA11149]|nr:anti-sigma factor [Cyanobacteria bacterium UBA11367]HBE58030.1 anti-sigma factor [Cyanobacteria bacterium UBA11366]HBK66265.1 anti-sigma factor [Cyanobacteria bacterium UBA11166]HBR72421.1 anti-sigma factor [Cyanobacteria bacterium UBA11159]HBS71954.1 anti-sigma factor [Cyanobacteria bacterium UBA11153]HBW90546.1 anti-sigma factor [Cyanobacteria bacterium UBA11149]HCA93935.1 anti-sigma factor [Cyanobacteria bacterium UBA9226]